VESVGVCTRANTATVLITYSYALADGAPPQRPTTTDPIQRKDANEGREGIKDVVQTADPLALVRVEAGDAEDGRRVDSDAGNSHPLLQDLEPDNQLHAPGRVQVSRADAEEHVEVRGVVGLLGLHADDVADLEVFFVGPGELVARGRPAQAAEDESRLLVPAGFDEVPG
jgi:hypothetical protein